MLEPGAMPLPGGLVLVHMVVSVEQWVFPVRVLNLAPEDVWLPSKGTTVSVSSMTETQGDMQCPLDRVQMGGTPVQQAELRTLLREYADVFAVCDEDLGYTDQMKHEILLTDDVPVAQAYRRIPPTS